MDGGVGVYLGHTSDAVSSHVCIQKRSLVFTPLSLQL